MRIKKLLGACAVGAFLVSGSVQASDPVLDASSRSALFESSQEALSGLTLENQALFLTAVDVVSIYHTQKVLADKQGEEVDGVDLLSLSAEEGDEIIKSTQEMLHGKTINEVIDLAASDEFLSARMAVGLMAEKMRQK